MTKIDVAVRVDIGIKETNDDRVLVSNRIIDDVSYIDEITIPAIAVVCDGCGGYAGGGIAAQTVLEVLSRETPETLADTNFLAQVLEKCKQEVFRKKQEMPAYSKMCTTVAGCVFCSDHINIFHAGDSRVYRFDKWGLSKMTTDHSVVQEMVDMGRITAEEALISPSRNIISRCIGASCPPPEIYVSYASIMPGDKYLLCSDGLWEFVSHDEISEILASDLPLDQMADILVNRALAKGSDDNLSVCICAAQEKAVVVETRSFILD